MLFTYQRQAKFEVLRWFLILSLLIPLKQEFHLSELVSIVLLILSFTVRFYFKNFWIHPKGAKIKLSVFALGYILLFFDGLPDNSIKYVPIFVILIGLAQAFSDFKKLSRFDTSLRNPVTFLRMIPCLLVWTAAVFRDPTNIFFSIACLITAILYILNEDFTYSS